jgi:hypothetical protein
MGREPLPFRSLRSGPPQTPRAPPPGPLASRPFPFHCRRRPAAVKATPAGRALRPALTAAGAAAALRAFLRAKGPREKFWGASFDLRSRLPRKTSWAWIRCPPKFRFRGPTRRSEVPRRSRRLEAPSHPLVRPAPVLVRPGPPRPLAVSSGTAGHPRGQGQPAALRFRQVRLPPAGSGPPSWAPPAGEVRVHHLRKLPLATSSKTFADPPSLDLLAGGARNSQGAAGRRDLASGVSRLLPCRLSLRLRSAAHASGLCTRGRPGRKAKPSGRAQARP